MGGCCRELRAAVQSVLQCQGRIPFAEELVTSPEQGVQSLQAELSGVPFPTTLGRGLLCGPRRCSSCPAAAPQARKLGGGGESSAPQWRRGPRFRNRTNSC